MISGPFRVTSSTARTQSQTLLAERRIIPYSTEIHWRLQNHTYKLGCYARKPHRWLLEYRWTKKFVCFLDRFHSVYSIGRQTSRRIFVVQGEDWQNGKRHPGQIIYGQNSGEAWQRMLSWRRNINGPMKNRNLISRRKLWWLANSESPSPLWRKWIPEQSQIRCRGTRSRHSMDTIFSVQKQKFAGDGEESTKVLRGVPKAKSYL